ncbi:MAG: TlpA disulfide reductase family protein [Chitinophagaceae bacterium]
MTPTLIFWIRIGIVGLVLFAIWSIVKAVRKQKGLTPSTPEEWKKLLPEVMFLGLGIFFLFWLEKNFQQQIDTVLSIKDKPLKGLYFINVQTGQPDSLAAYKGKVVVLNLWATWCGPCRKELPSLERLNADYKDEVVVLALSDENTDIVSQFKNEKNLTLQMGSYNNYPFLDSLSSRPVSILLDKDNQVKDVMVGAREYSFFKKWITPYLPNSK